MAAAAADKPKRPSICHSCKAQVIWVLLERKRQPIEKCPPGVAGDVALEPEFVGFESAGGLARAVFVGSSTGYRRHIDSCPDAAKWRDRWKSTAERPFSRVERKKQR